MGLADSGHIQIMGDWLVGQVHRGFYTFDHGQWGSSGEGSQGNQGHAYWFRGKSACRTTPQDRIREIHFEA